MRKWVKKNEENDQQTENLQLFLKTGNGHKDEETDAKMRKRIENIGKSLKNKRPV